MLQTTPHCLLGTPLLCCEVPVCPALHSHVTTQHSIRGLPLHSSTWDLSSASRPVSPTSHQTPHRCSVTSHSTHPTLKSAPSLFSSQSCSSSSAWIPSPWRVHHLLRCSGLQPGVIKVPRAPPRLTHHTPHRPDLLRVFEDHSSFHSLCLQFSTRSHHFMPEPEQQVLGPLLHPAAQSSLSGDGGTDSPEEKTGSGRAFYPWKALQSQGLGSEPRRANRLPGRRASASPPATCLPSATNPTHPALPAGFLHRTLSLSGLHPSPHRERPGRMSTLGQSGSVRAQQSRPPFGCARNPRKVPHFPLLDGSISPAEDTPYLSLYLTCQVHHLAMRRHRQSVR